MNRSYMKILGHLIILLLFIGNGCQYNFPTTPEIEIKSEEADFSNTVVIGGRYTSGFMDGALYNDAQQKNYIHLFVEHFYGDSTNSFNELSISSENGFNTQEVENTTQIQGKYEIAYRAEVTDWEIRQPINGEEIQDYEGSLRNINNFSFPGIRSYQVDGEPPMQNRFVSRVADRLQGNSILDQAIEKNPSLVILDIATDDIFDFTLNGASGDENPEISSVVHTDLTPVSVFEQSIQEAIQRLLNETDADIIIPTIPNPLELPYFQNLPWYFTSSQFRLPNVFFNFNFCKEPGYCEMYYFNEFNVSVNEFNRGRSGDERRPIVDFDAGGGERFRGKLIIDEALPTAIDSEGDTIPKLRQLTQEDLFLYNGEIPQYESLLSDGEMGAIVPLADKFALTSSEQETITARRQAFNTIITQLTQSSSRVYLLDIAKLIDDVELGLVNSNGTAFELTYGHRSIISADGYTMNQKGQALFANKLIELLNEEFSSNIPYLDPNTFKGIDYSFE